MLLKKYNLILLKITRVTLKITDAVCIFPANRQKALEETSKAYYLMEVRKLMISFCVPSLHICI